MSGSTLIIYLLFASSFGLGNFQRCLFFYNFQFKCHGKYAYIHHQEHIRTSVSVRVCNSVKFGTGRKLLPSLKLVIVCNMLCMLHRHKKLLLSM